jgi:hypothetical protein
MNKYVIIDAEAIQQRIEELEDKIQNDGLFPQEIQYFKGEIHALKRLLSQSTPLIPEIEKAFDAGGAYTLASHKDFKQIHPNKKQYISNLKLDI